MAVQRSLQTQLRTWHAGVALDGERYPDVTAALNGFAKNCAWG